MVSVHFCLPFRTQHIYFTMRTFIVFAIVCATAVSAQYGGHGHGDFGGLQGGHGLGSYGELSGHGDGGQEQHDGGAGAGGHGHEHEHYVDYHSHPSYHYDYAVHDLKHHDIKTQWETRDGDKVKGEYSLVEPDGTKRIVSYTSDKHSGFNAVVKRIGHAVHPIHFESDHHEN